jgi:UDP-N-acetylmuramyl pentapeptide phosphotransferase/UDP-N-acetylglucosamine-1-phosphate transferase
MEGVFGGRRPEMWKTLVVVFAIALALSAGLIAALRPAFARYAMARPNARSSHTVPTPQGGGIAVVAATLAGAWLAATLSDTGLSTIEWLALSVATVLLALTGAIDDIRGLGAGSRLLVQVVAVGLIIAALPDDFAVVPQLARPFERALLLLGGVWFVNLVNFMDGIDWMTVAEVVPVTAGVVLLGFTDGAPPGAVAVAVALLGAIIGFAPFNRPVARLFLGDVGSLPIGLLLGWLMLMLAGRNNLAAAILLPLYYLADATITLARRLIRREAVWQAHRTHSYQRATDGGFSVEEIVVRVFVTNLALAGLALITAIEPDPRVDVATIALGGSLVAWLLLTFQRGKR